MVHNAALFAAVAADYFPDYSLLITYFLFPTLKKQLAGLTMSLEEFKTKWEGSSEAVSLVPSHMKSYEVI